jgi:hypothetical protein
VAEEKTEKAAHSAVGSYHARDAGQKTTACSVRLEAGFARALALYMDDAYFETAGEALAGLAARNDAMSYAPRP